MPDTRSSNNALLVVEDSDEDFNTLKRLFKQLDFSVPIQRCCDGDEVLDLFYHQNESARFRTKPLPSLILMDLNLPGTDGREVIAQLKKDDTLKNIPIVVLTTSDNPNDVATCYQNGANSYMIKMMKLDEMKKSLQTFIDFWFLYTILPETQN